MIAALGEAIGPAAFFILLLLVAAAWHTLDKNKRASESVDCKHCGAPGPYSQHPGICWGCLMLSQDQTKAKRMDEERQIAGQLKHGQDWDWPERWER